MGLLGYKLENMVPSPAGEATARALITTEDGILLCYGTTKPTDGTAGYCVGCLFVHVDGSAGSVLYLNEGSVTSCDFDAVANGS
jgi:hypothetical protein